MIEWGQHKDGSKEKHMHITNFHFGDNAFPGKFEINDKSPLYIGLAMMYFGMTTLSTVGLGDYYPVSNSEQIMGCILFLLGVTTFSYIFSSYLDILNVWLKLENDFDDEQSLD